MCRDSVTHGALQLPPLLANMCTAIGKRSSSLVCLDVAHSSVRMFSNQWVASDNAGHCSNKHVARRTVVVPWSTHAATANKHTHIQELLRGQTYHQRQPSCIGHGATIPVKKTVHVPSTGSDTNGVLNFWHYNNNSHGPRNDTRLVQQHANDYPILALNKRINQWLMSLQWASFLARPLDGCPGSFAPGASGFRAHTGARSGS